MLTIITTCKGRVHHLKGLVECLQKQTFKEWRCIVVAYGCYDTHDYFYTIKDPRFILIPAVENGFNLSKARNIGVEHLYSEKYEGMVMFLDADTLLTDDFLKRVHDDLQPNYEKYGPGFFTGEPNCSGNCMVNLFYIEQAGLYDEAFEGWGGEDADFYIRLQNNGYFLHKNPFPLGMSYQDHPESESDKFHSIKKWDAQKKNIQRLFSKYPKEWIVPEYIAPELVSRFI